MAQTIQQFRHEARAVLADARQALRLQTEATGALYALVNGSIDSLLEGRPGYTKDEQVALLVQAKDTALANREALAAAVEQAKAEVVAAMEAWDFDTPLAEVADLLDKAAQVAATRDFEGHQSEKQALAALDFSLGDGGDGA